MVKRSGILLHISSLPEENGNGGLGRSAYDFIDFLSKSKQSLWQILPLNPPDEYNSPYRSTSVFAGNTDFINLKLLSLEGLLERKEICAEKNDVYLRKAYSNYLKRNNSKRELDSFLEDNNWLDSYALFCILKRKNSNQPWFCWKDSEKNISSIRKDKLRNEFFEEYYYNIFLQLKFFEQWRMLKKYANNKAVLIIGDLPFYVAEDSADVWAEKKLFEISKEGKIKNVAGVPPDYFSKTGQKWGNPLYDWRNMSENGFRWWRERIKQAGKMYDFIRLDHFRAFADYWSIPAEEKNAVMGKWKEGPGKDLLFEIGKEVKIERMIAEDLGELSQKVILLKKELEITGMKVLQFISSEEYPRRKETENLAFYPGTHDNDTLRGWYEKIVVKKKLTDKEAEMICKVFIELIYLSFALYAIVPFQDLLALGNEARMNTPGTIENNWTWKLREEDLKSEIISFLSGLSEKSGRN